MSYKLEVTGQYLKDLKRARKRKFDEALLNKVVAQLMEGTPLAPKHRDHVLVGDYRGKRECHITPDWLLIYSKDESIRLIKLVRTGTHSDLF